jgi:galactokinase
LTDSAAAARDFRSLYGGPAAVGAEAPGRVNLIGEHTDYNGGYVLPTTIPQRTFVEAAPGAGSKVRAWSASFPEEMPSEYVLGQEKRGGGWLDYAQAITWAVGERGIDLPGLDARIASDVPLGGGLSSSASFEVALLRALRKLFDLPFPDLEIAKLAHRAETGFVGAPVGVMDQMVWSLGSASSALFLDTRSLATESIPLPASIELGVLDSGIRHSHAGGEYRVRRAECEEAARLLGVASLRDLEGSPPSSWESLPEPLNRRVRHVVTENRRVLETVEALKREEAPRIGRLLAESHASLRDDFEVSIPELDTLVELAGAERAIFGARMTGGGFGGSIVMIGEAGQTLAAARTIARGYTERTGRAAAVLLPDADQSGALHRPRKLR